MTEFHSTRMGVRFFEVDVSRLVTAVVKIADCLVSLRDQSVPPPARPPDSDHDRSEMMMDLQERLQSLWAGVLPEDDLPQELAAALRDAEWIVAALRRLNA